jgi:hypothetical protein
VFLTFNENHKHLGSYEKVTQLNLLNKLELIQDSKCKIQKYNQQAHIKSVQLITHISVGCLNQEDYTQVS